MRMKRAQRLVMVACVATALCADRVGAAVPSLRPQAIETARTIAGRLVVSFRRIVPAVRLHEARREERPIALRPVCREASAPHTHPCPLAPSLYRLPPPAA